MLNVLYLQGAELEILRKRRRDGPVRSLGKKLVCKTSEFVPPQKKTVQISVCN